MSEPLDFGFGKFVPGFDFLQTLAQGAAKTNPPGSAIPNLGGWVAPTLDTEELDKRVSELRTVQFWLEQNANALKATIQALEVQKMTLSALKGMNVRVADMAEAFKIKTPAPEDTTSDTVPQPQSAPPAVDPVKWWGALTEQFQQIASTAMKDATSAASSHASHASRASSAKSAASAKSTRPAAKKKSTSKAATRKPARS